jgi:hypothetical protein
MGPKQGALIQPVVYPVGDAIIHITAAFLVRKKGRDDENQYDQQQGEYEINGCSKHNGTSPKNAVCGLYAMKYKKVI